MSVSPKGTLGRAQGLQGGRSEISGGSRGPKKAPNALQGGAWRGPRAPKDGKSKKMKPKSQFQKRHQRTRIGLRLRHEPARAEDAFDADGLVVQAAENTRRVLVDLGGVCAPQIVGHFKRSVKAPSSALERMQLRYFKKYD